MKRRFAHLREEARALRRRGKTYEEIKRELGVVIPKSTLSLWSSDIPLSTTQQKRIERINNANLSLGRKKSALNRKTRRYAYVARLSIKASALARELKKNKQSAKLALTMLYLGEGSKTRRGALMFGNADPITIRLFLRLLHLCYPIDKKKFRCTVQCRADQDTDALKKFWSYTTGIPLNQFYESRIDPRTQGRKTLKPEYKGVCRIDYFSAEIYNELRLLPAELEAQLAKLGR